MISTAAHRRDFLIRSAGVLGGTAILPSNRALAQAIPVTGRMALPPWLHKTSSAVVNAVNASALELNRNAARQGIASIDVRRFSTSFTIFSAHLAEVGALPDLRRAFERSRTLEVPLNLSQLEKARQETAKKVKLTDSQFRRWASEYENGYLAFVAEFNRAGILGIHAQLINSLDGWAQRIDRDFNGVLRSGWRVQPATLLNCEQINEGIAIAGIYTATWGYMIWIGAAVFGPVGEAFLAVGGVVLAFLGALCA